MPSIKKPLINIDELKKEVELVSNTSFKWFYSDVTGSTNSDLLNHKLAYSIAITESQKQGRGQRNNTWQDSHSDNLLFSIALPAPINDTLTLLPIKIGLAIKTALNQAGFNDITLKWPNDIFYQEKKLGGILTESITQDKQALIVIGVGLNINMPYKDNDPFISLKHKENIDRTPLLAQCLNSILTSFNSTQVNTITHFNKAHLFHLKTIQFNTDKTTVKGTCHGINEQGQLLIKTQDDIMPYSNGSIIMGKS